MIKMNATVFYNNESKAIEMECWWNFKLENPIKFAFLRCDFVRSVIVYRPFLKHGIFWYVKTKKYLSHDYY